jgi:predicted metal-dependent enzyme (double-stranded beta helix superfamily)
MSAQDPGLRGPHGIARLREFVSDMSVLVESKADEARILAAGRALLAALVARDDWLPDEYAVPDPVRYQQYLLYCDSRERFSVVSFVWGPGQSTPIHDHRAWGLVGVLRGAERSEPFTRDAPGAGLTAAPAERMEPSSVSAVSPRIGDIHRVSNAYDDRVSISIHVYGANIGATPRATYDAAGYPKRFVSGYANRTLPNLWDRSSPE